MKALATALVLIAGAAVVLWYGNTLNSWVLGGLIGGLAALLLSIPISLILFSYFSRRYGESVKIEETADDEVALETVYMYREVPIPTASSANVYIEDEDEVHASLDYADWDEEDEEDEDDMYPFQPPVRQLPPPVSQNSNRYLRPSVTRRFSRQLSGCGDEPTTRRLTEHTLADPAFPGYQPGMTRSQFQSQALRMARQEAARQHQEELEIESLLASRVRRPSSSIRRSRLLQERGERSRSGERNRSSYGYRKKEAHTELPYQSDRDYSQQIHRVVDASPSPNSPYRAPLDTDKSRSQQTSHYEDPETESIDLGLSTGNLKKPLLRRAPYLYADDNLRNELAQHADAPVARRSSRYLSNHYDEE